VERIWRRPPPYRSKALFISAAGKGSTDILCMSFLASKISALFLDLQLAEQSHWDELTLIAVHTDSYCATFKQRWENKQQTVTWSQNLFPRKIHANSA